MNNPWTNAYNHPNFAGYNKEQIDEMLMCELEEIYNYEWLWIRTRNNRMRKLIWKLYNENMISIEVAEMLLEKHYE